MDKMNFEFLEQEIILLTDELNSLINQDKLSDALNKSKKLLIYIKNLKVDTINIAISYNTLGLINRKVGNFHTSAIYYQKSLKIFEELEEDESENYISIKNNLAIVLIIIADYQNSEKLLFELLRFKQSKNLKNTSSYAITLNNLGSLKQSMGMFDEAKIYFNESLKIRIDKLGDDYCEYKNNINFLSTKIFSKVDKENWGDYAQSLFNLAELCRCIGNYQNAEIWFKESGDIRKTIDGETSLSYSNCLNNLAEYYKTIGNFDEAYKSYLKSISIISELYGNNHPSYANRQINLASLLCSGKKFYEAESIFNEYFKWIKHRRFILKLDYARYLTNSGLNALFLRNYLISEKKLKKALKIRKRLLVHIAT